MTARDLLHDLAVADDLADDQLIRRARSRFLAASLAVGLVLAAVAFVVAEAMTERNARDDARARAQIVAAVVGASIRAAEDPARRGELSAAVDAVAEAQSVSQVVVWRADGKVAWAHDKALVGRTFELDDELQRLFARAGSLLGSPGSADLDGADGPASEGNYEVFSTSQGAGGEPLVVESYVVRSSIAEHQREALWTLLPLAAGALLLFEGTFLGLGMLMIRQVRRGRQRRIRLTMAAMTSVDRERRELAHELHDGIVQDLAATRYALAGISDALPAGLEHDPKAKLERIQEVLRHELLDLRGLLGHLLSPPDPVSSSLEQSLDVAVHTLVPRGTRHQVEVRCPPLSTEESRVIYRVVREGVSNAVRHAGAHAIRVVVCAETRSTGGPQVNVLVEDDGTGPGHRPGAETHGHFGLALLAGLVRDHGGTLSLQARHDGPGSRLTATVPLGGANGVNGADGGSPARRRGRRTRNTRADPGTPGTTGVEGRASHGSGVGAPRPDAAESAQATL